MVKEIHINDHYPLDLIPLDFHLWGYTKDLVNQTTLMTGNLRHIMDGAALMWNIYEGMQTGTCSFKKKLALAHLTQVYLGLGGTR